MAVITFRPHAFSPHARCYVLGHRLHHGMTGLMLMAVGAFLIGHDWPDRWFCSDRDAFRA